MATMNVSLPDQMKKWVEEQTKDGTYANASDYVRDLIRKARQRQDALDELQTLVSEGIASGPAVPFDFDGYIERKKREGRRLAG